MDVTQIGLFEWGELGGVWGGGVKLFTSGPSTRRITGSAMKLTLVNGVRWTLHRLVTSSGEKGVGSEEVHRRVRGKQWKPVRLGGAKMLDYDPDSDSIARTFTEALHSHPSPYER